MARAIKRTKPPLHSEKLLNSMLNEALCRLIIIPPSLELPPTFQPLRPRHSPPLRNKKQALDVTVYHPIFCCQRPIRRPERKAIRYTVGNESHHVQQNNQSITFHRQ